MQNPRSNAWLLLSLLFVAVAFAHSGTNNNNNNGNNGGNQQPLMSARPYDTQCKPTYATRAALERAEPFKGTNLGYFNCTGAMTTYDAKSGNMISNVNVPPFLLHTIYNSTCGCWVTANQLSPYVIYEHINEERGHGLQGTCLNNEFSLPGIAGPVKVVGFSRNRDLVHRDLPYFHPANGTLAGHQTIYLQRNGNEVVNIRLFDPTTGVPVSIQNLLCTKIASQPW